MRKTNLIVFLRPHIINTREDLINVTRGAQYRFEGAKDVRTDTESMLREDFELAPERQYTPPEEEAPADEEPKSEEEPVSEE